MLKRVIPLLLLCLASAAQAQRMYTMSPVPPTIATYTILCNNTASVAAPIQCKFADTSAAGNLALVVGNYSPVSAAGATTNKYNTIFGVGAGDALTNIAGTQGNTVFGYNALLSGLTTSQEDAFGKLALRDDIEGTFNTAVGSAAMRCFTGTGNKNGNVAVGHGAMAGDDTACATTPGGYPGTGGGNTALGAWSGQLFTTATANVLAGDSSGVDLTTGSNNVGIGFYALCAPTTFATTGQACAGVQQAVGIGYHALRFNQVNATIGIGYEALGALTTGTLNVALGFQALSNETTGSASTALGYDALLSQALSAGFNTAVGANAGKLLTTGTQDTYVGANAGLTQTTTNGTTALGAAALTLATGGGNTALGNHTGAAVTTGNTNTIIGSGVGSTTLTTGAGNILIGVDSSTDTDAPGSVNTLKLCGTGSCPITATGMGAATPPTTIGGTFIVNNAAGSTQFGAVNSASPVNQTVTAQGSRGTTDTNVAGANVRVQSGLGTGNAAGSSYIIATPAATGSGTTQQTATDRLTFTDGQAAFASVGVISNSPTGGNLGTGTWNQTGIYATNGVASTYTLFRWGVPVVLPSSGAFGTNGSVTLTTAITSLATICSTTVGCYMYFPSGAICATCNAGGVNAAGMYYTQCTTTTACTAFNNILVTGVPIKIASPTAFSSAAPAAYTQTINTYLVMITLSLPGNSMGANGSFTVDTKGARISNADVVNENVTFGGSSVGLINVASQQWYGYHHTTTNMGATNTQVSFAGASAGSDESVVNAAPTFTAIDSTVSQNVVIKGNIVTAATDWEIFFGGDTLVNYAP